MTAWKSIITALLYAALTLGAIPLAAENIADLRNGDMRKLVIHDEPRPMLDSAFMDEAGAPLTLEHFKGKIVVLNFWATWCAPCRKEMPALDALNETLGSDKFEVVAMATGRNPLPLIKRFFDETDLNSLTIYRDPKQQLARAMSVFGLPMTVILNDQGQEIARLQGEAEWNTPEAQAILTAFINQLPK